MDEPLRRDASARVWVVEDSPPEAKRVAGVLSASYTVDVFPDASSMLEQLSRGGSPHLLVLDWRLPGISGLEACRSLRERYDELTLPILVVTSGREREDLRQALAAGANDFLHKPYDDAELLARTRTLVRVRQQAEALHDFKDVTARRATEAEADRMRLTTILATLEEGVILQDAQGAVHFINTAAERLLGLSGDQLAGRTLADPRWGAVRTDGSPYPSEEHPPMRALRSGQGVRGDVMGLHHPDGGLVWLSINSQPLFEPDGTTLAGVVSSFFDVTAQRAAEAERERLRREVEVAHMRLATLVEHAPAFICLLRGPDHVYVLVNPPYLRLVGTGRKLLGLPVREALPEVVEQGFIGLLDGVYRTGQPFFGSEVPIRLDRRGDGTLEDSFVSFVYQPARDSTGHVMGIDVFGFDITEQVRARQRVEALAERLRESEERLRRVVEASGTGTWEMDTATEMMVADARFREMFGLSADEPFPLDKGMSIIHPEDRPRVAQALAGALAGHNGGRFHAEYRTVPTSDGRWRWVESRGHARFGADGRCERILGAGVDVTARKEAEAAREAFLDALARQPGVAVAMFRGPDLIVDMANPLYHQLAGGRDVVGKPLLQVLPELRGQGLDELLHRVLRTGEPFIAREHPIRFDRRGEGVLEQGYFHFVFQPVRGPDGAPRSVLTIAQEVTDVVHARQEAQRLMVLEQERAGFEQQLIGIVSHDLRSPIAAITMGAAVLLRRPDMEERQRRTLERILSSAGRANRMIHDLLDFTQARLGGGLTAQRLPGDFHAIVRQVVEESQVSNPGRLLRLTQTGDGGGEWDADRLAQLVSNLLSNALHYSPPDSTVRIETRGEPEHLVLAVHNAGAPIPPEVLPRLFQPLQRGVAGVSEGRSVGLGLYIVDQVVRAHGGSISVTSSHEDGTTFTVCLPRHAAAGAQAS